MPGWMSLKDTEALLPDDGTAFEIKGRYNSGDEYVGRCFRNDEGWVTVVEVKDGLIAGPPKFWRRIVQ